MGNGLKTQLSTAAHRLLRRQLEIVAEWMRTFGQLQHTPYECDIIEIVHEMTSYFAEVIRRGYYLNGHVYAAHTHMLDTLVDTTVPMYRTHVFAIYMHPNGSFRSEWRGRTVDGVLPLSARTDVTAEDARTAQVASDVFTQLTAIHS